ncbi:MAG: very short patch repair endonuclease [Candidatus Omnitrophota bacterium]
MVDIWSPEKRSQVMSRIKGKNTKPEILMRQILRRLGYRYHLRSKHLPGKPDIILPRRKLAIFVHGCFWHYHGRCREGRIPSTRRSYWKPKLLANRDRDAKKRSELKKLGWKILTVWECQIEKKPEAIVGKLTKVIYGRKFKPGGHQ